MPDHFPDIHPRKQGEKGPPKMVSVSLQFQLEVKNRLADGLMSRRSHGVGAKARSSWSSSTGTGGTRREGEPPFGVQGWLVRKNGCVAQDMGDLATTPCERMKIDQSTGMRPSRAREVFLFLLLLLLLFFFFFFFVYSNLPVLPSSRPSDSKKREPQRAPPHSPP